MHLRDFRVGWRMLARQPVQTAAMVLGLALGLATAFLLLGFVQYSFSYDSAVPQRDRIYVLKHRLHLLAQPQWVERMPLPAWDVLAGSGLPLTLCVMLPHTEALATGSVVRDVTFTEVSATFPDMFGVRALAGDLPAALARPDGLAVTPQGAIELFGAADVLGRTVAVNGRVLRVLALLPEPQPNTTMPYRALVGTGTVLWTPGARDALRHKWLALAGKLFVKPADAVPPRLVAELVQRQANRALAQVVGEDTARRLGGTVIEVGITSLAQAYFDTDVAAFDGGPRAARGGVLALAALALLVLALAVTNYVHLAALRVLARAREIAVRKTMGAGTRRLALQFVAESVLAALAATVVGLLLAWLALPLFSALMDRPLAAFLAGPAVLAAILSGIVVGILCGVWPARMALHVLPGQALGGRTGRDTAGGPWLRRGLTVFQFAAAIGLCALALAVGWQARFAARADPGFALDRFVQLRVPRLAPAHARQDFRAALARQPAIAAVAAIDRPFGAAAVPLSSAFRRRGGDERRIELALVDAGFFQAAGIAAQAGRLFDAGRPEAAQRGDALLNEAAAMALGFPSARAAIGAAITGSDGAPLRVVGIVPPLRHHDLRHPLQPMVYQVEQGEADVIMVRAGVPAPALEAALAPLWQHYFPGYPLAVEPATQGFAAGSADDRRAASLLALGAAVATGIAAFGIYVLAAASVQQRSREIVLRKLHGASRRAIGVLVVAEFGLLLLAAAALALPPAAWAIVRYLAGFAATAPEAWWALPAALLLALVVALAATTRHTVIALRLSPAAALRQA